MSGLPSHFPAPPRTGHPEQGSVIHGIIRRVDLRTVGMIIILDALTYFLVYWIAFPAFMAVIDALDPIVSTGIVHTVAAVRLSIIGLLAARSYRRRRGMHVRTDAVPSVAVGAALTLVLGLIIGVASRALADVPEPSALVYLAAIGEGLVFPMFGLLFAVPGSADRLRSTPAEP